MASEIRVNKIENRSGLGTVTFADTGVDLAGIVTATTFSGSGASLTALPAAQVTGTLPAISGANLTNLAAANLTGTIADARFPATLPAASAANLTSIPAANVTGTLPALTAANLTNIPAANLVGVCTSGLTKTGGFGPTGWTHVNSAAIGSVNSYTWTGIPTDTQHIIIYYDSLSADGSYYPSIQIGDSGGIETTGYESAVGYLENSYQYVSEYTSRVPLVRDNYGTAVQVFKGVVNCWRQPNTNKWHFRLHSGRAANTTLFFSNAYKELSGDITQVKILLNGGSFDGGNIALSYYQD